MRHRSISTILNAPITITKVAIIAALRVIKIGCKLKVAQRRIHEAFLVVVIDLSPMDGYAVDSKVKNTGMAGAGSFGFRQIGFPGFVNREADNWMVSRQLLQMPFSPKD